MTTIKTGDKTKAQIVALADDINKVQWNKNLNFHALKAILTAVDFVPTTPGDWTTAPTTVDEALDELGSRSSVGAETSSNNVFTAYQIIDNGLAIRFRELTANGTNYVAMKAPDSLAANYTVTLPASTDTLATLTGTETFASKTLKSSCTFGDATDTTKALAVSLSGATTAKTTTLTFAHTDNRTITFPDAAGTVALTSNIGTDVRATATVSLASTDIVALKATPKQLVAAPSAGQAIIVEHIEMLHTYAVAQYNGGGTCKVQYKNTASGGGVVLGPDLATLIKAGSTSNSMWSVSNTAVDMADVTAQGLFLSTDTAEFGAGDAGNVLKIRISYRVVTVVA